MNRISDLKQIKSARAKNTLSTMSFSASTKLSSKVRLSEIFEYMSSEYPFSDLAEIIEKETGGKFTQLTFREIIDKVYSDLSINDKIFLIKHLPLSKIGITPYSPLIYILYLFKFIESITKEKIISPSLIFYEIVERLKNRYDISTIDYFQSLNLEPEKEITMEDFYLYLGNKMGLDEISEIVLFKSIDYDKDNKIKISDLILVIDSYRNDNLDEKTFSMDNTAKKNSILLKNFLEKNMITIDLIYEKADYNYMRYDDIKSFLLNEIYNYKRFANTDDSQINETIVDSVLNVIKRDEKIFKNDFKHYLGRLDIDPNNNNANNNDNNDNNNNNNINIIELNYKQKYWINKYLDLINSIKSTPKIIFNSSKKNPDSNVVNILDLLKKIIRLSPSGKLSSDEMTQIMNALDINSTGLIEFNQYEIIINQIQDLKDKIKTKIDSQDFYSSIYLDSINYDRKTINMWSKGVKSPYYHLLPAKGNYEVLDQINQDIKNNLINDDKENDINSNNIKNKKIKKIKNKSKKNNFIEEKSFEGDEGAIFEENDINTGKKEKYYTNDKNMATDNIINISEYNEEDLVKIALDNFNFKDIYFPDNDLLLYLKENKISEKTSEDIIKYIDNNDDGLISVVDLFKFLLYEMKYKSIKLVLKYLYIKIYKELELKSSYKFFKKNKFNVQKQININKLIKFFETIYIDSPLTRKIYDTLKYIFKPPILYINLCQLIDEFQNNSLLIENKNKSQDKNIEKKNDNNNDNINNNIIMSFDIDYLDNEMKNVVRNLIDLKDYKGNDTLRCKNLNDKVEDMLSEYSENLNFSQFEENFAKKLNISPTNTNVIFNLLKHTSLKGEKQQLLSQKDLLMFLQTYCYETDKSNYIYDNKINEDEEGLSIAEIKNNVSIIEQSGPPLQYSFEKIPFRSNGLISCAELLKYVDIFYNNSIPRKDLKNIISCIDEEQIGFINYKQLQLFLNNYSNINKFSALLEIQIIACNIYKKNYTKSQKYFKSLYKNINFDEIDKKLHYKILSHLCSNINNKKKLFNYFINISKVNNNYYNLKLLTNKIDELLEIETILKIEKNRSKKDENNEEDNLGLPDKTTVENALKLINLGKNGHLSMNELLLKMKKGYRKSFSDKIDKKHKGFISFPDFINKCRKIYGTDINLNYKLCSQYLYKVFILSPDKVKPYILKKLNKSDSNIYLDKSELYNSFMFAFCNDKYLFESFFLIYCEKKGKYKNKLSLNSLLLFIYTNNPDLKYLESTLRFNNNNKDQIDSTNKKKIVIEILNKKITNVREIIENINYNNSKLQKNFSISEKYINNLLQNHFNFTDDESEEICNYFRLEEGKFDLKKFYDFDPNNDKNRNIILQDDILPKIQNHINKSIYKSYKEYKKAYFKSDYLDICELYTIFNKLYNITLYQCLLIILGYKGQYLSIEDFFKDNNLKDYFPSKDFDPTLKLAIIRLNEYIEENYKDKKEDKLKIFKGYDTNKDGILSSEEFITALNSLKGLNLNDNQKYKLYNFADTNKDGKINAKEFLELIKQIKNYINEEGELNAPLPANSIPNYQDNKKYIPKILDKPISSIKSNYKFNKKKIKNLKNNTFISCIVKLQEDLINNYYNDECIENDFLLADKEEEGYIKENIFKIILQKRLFSVDEEIYNLFIKFSEDDEEQKDNANNNEEESSENNGNKKEAKRINYKIFLNKLADYRIKNDNYEKSENSLPIIK